MTSSAMKQKDLSLRRMQVVSTWNLYIAYNLIAMDTPIYFDRHFH